MTFNKYTKFQLILIFTSVMTVTTNTDIFHPQVNFTVDGGGFHRTINFEVIIDEINNNEECYVALYLDLLTSLYVNINELPDLMKRQKFTVCSDGETDVELFAEDAKPQQITMCSKLTTPAKFNLPIHQRYQRAREHGTYVNVTLPEPKLLISCKQEIKEYPVSDIQLCELCAQLSSKWVEIPYKMGRENYTWTIPVGDLSMEPYVTWITLFVSWSASIYLLKVLLTPRRQHTKNE